MYNILQRVHLLYTLVLYRKLHVDFVNISEKYLKLYMVNFVLLKVLSIA